MSNDSKQEILHRVRTSLAGGRADPANDYRSIQREYRQSGILLPEERTHLFVERIEDYGCAVYSCLENEIAVTLTDVLTQRGKRTLLTTAEVNKDWLADSINFIQDHGLTYFELDAAEGVLTCCALAIAETGSIVLRHSQQVGRRAVTLIPDYHVCLVFEHQIVETVPEALRKMAAFGSDPITTISGPSATADIEMTRIKGVHGPRTLDVILIRSI